MRNTYDIIVIGGGHAGIEAAWAAARAGAEVALVTMQREAIGRMSCNPAIGGIGKGQMVREVDALGGLMGLASDAAGIQFRMLNRRKGPAVWAPRAQADRHGYPHVVQELLCRARSLEIIEGSVEQILADEIPSDDLDVSPEIASSSGDCATSTRGPKHRVRGLILADGRRLNARAVIVTTGTFLRALMHCGPQRVEGGRVGEQSAVGLSDSLRSLGFELGRLKTGTPPRVHRDSIDYSQVEVQYGDEFPTPFSAMTDAILQPQVNCWITWTNEEVHVPIRANLHRAPMYSGQIESRGPRYCPSIEDKVVRFADKSRHQVFLEPEGYDNERVYCNGISTSLPGDVQDDMVRRIPGLQQARILQYGYAVEYDFVPTHQTKSSLETKLVSGLFLAGQINGTSGYEEAAGQGIVAGVNAVQFLRDAEPLVLRRDQAYIGVMIDDLVTRPPTEPYRMFTSRAEFRLLLRSDNADERLTPVGRRLRLVDDIRWERFTEREALVDELEQRLGLSRGNARILSQLCGNEEDLAVAARLLGSGPSRPVCSDVLERVLIGVRYRGYVDRQARHVERMSRLESMVIPERLNYARLSGLRAEARERLAAVAPRTLGQASRISGINPADVTVLWVALSGGRRRRRTEDGTVPVA
ncbi:MAG: tRNA uridine-5-carboxymethylaminomethyl(34) synthesis enzyme MnmG [Phycisphaerae bacterium]|nr:tRNA uridine-5-carboxymethylaminomethyl(34) synthesis enzyme MnmG [Phycisphaerae bacterium]